MLNLVQHLVKVFSTFGRHTFHPRPQDGVFRCNLNKGWFKFQLSELNQGQGVNRKWITVETEQN